MTRQDAIHEHTALLSAIVSILVRNGLTTVEELERLVVSDRQKLDQMLAESRERELAELRNSPAGSMLLKLMGMDEEVGP